LGTGKSVKDEGPSIKYVTLEGVRESVTVCDRGGGSSARDVTLIIFLPYI